MITVSGPSSRRATGAEEERKGNITAGKGCLIQRRMLKQQIHKLAMN